MRIAHFCDSHPGRPDGVWRSAALTVDLLRGAGHHVDFHRPGTVPSLPVPGRQLRLGSPWFRCAPAGDGVPPRFTCAPDPDYFAAALCRMLDDDELRAAVARDGLAATAAYPPEVHLSRLETVYRSLPPSRR